MVAAPRVELRCCLKLRIRRYPVGTPESWVAQPKQSLEPKHFGGGRRMGSIFRGGEYELEIAGALGPDGLMPGYCLCFIGKGPPFRNTPRVRPNQYQKLL